MPIKIDRIETDSLKVNGFDVNQSIKHYELDMTGDTTVTVDTTKGIIDIINMGTELYNTPQPSFSSSTSFVINNPGLTLIPQNRDNIYVQYSVYYKPTINDNARPYLISTGFNNGLQFYLYNANPASADTNNWTGALYVYFELYTIN